MINVSNIMYFQVEWEILLTFTFDWLRIKFTKDYASSTIIIL